MRNEPHPDVQMSVLSNGEGETKASVAGEEVTAAFNGLHR